MVAKFPDVDLMTLEVKVDVAIHVLTKLFSLMRMEMTTRELTDADRERLIEACFYDKD